MQSFEIEDYYDPKRISIEERILYIAKGEELSNKQLLTQVWQESKTRVINFFLSALLIAFTLHFLGLASTTESYPIVGVGFNLYIITSLIPTSILTAGMRCIVSENVSKGRKDQSLYFYACFIGLLIYHLILYAGFWFSSSIFIMMGFEKGIAIKIESFLTATPLLLFSTICLELLKEYYYALNFKSVSVFTNSCVLVMYWVLGNYFLNQNQIEETEGIIKALSASHALALLLLLTFTRMKKPLDISYWLIPSGDELKTNLVELVHKMKKSSPNNSLQRVWIRIVLLVLAFSTHQDFFAGFILQNISDIFSILPVVVFPSFRSFISRTIRLTELGKAQSFLKVLIILCFLWLFGALILYYQAKEYLFKFYTHNSSTYELLEKLSPVWVFCLVGENIQLSLINIAQSIGAEELISKSLKFLYYAISLPSCLLVVLLGKGAFEVWICLVITTYSHSFWLIKSFKKLNWEDQVNLIQNRPSNSSEVPLLQV
jgi:hypothetical protein